MDKGYRVSFSIGAEKDLKKMDAGVRRLVLAWLDKNIEGCNNPRLFGKALVDKSDTGGKDLSNKWRYRVGDMRLICDINDDEVIVLVVHVAHRSKVYK